MSFKVPDRIIAFVGKAGTPHCSLPLGVSAEVTECARACNPLDDMPIDIPEGDDPDGLCRKV